MKKNIREIYSIFAIFGAYMALSLACVSDPETISSASTSLNNALANSYSSTSEYGLEYSFYNRSSYTITLWDATGSRSISPGGSTTARFNKDITVHSIVYSPSNLVAVSQSGASFYFKDR